MENLYDLIVIGSGPAGVSAAIYAGRAMLRTLVLDSNYAGGQIGITSDIVNYPGIISISGAELNDNMTTQAKNFGAQLETGTVTKVDFSNDIKEVHTDDGKVYKSIAVVIATGARPRKLGIPGEEKFTGRGVGYCATCDGEFFKGKDIFVVGGGFAAAEEAIFLTRYAKKVYILVRGDKFSCAPSVAEKVMSHDKIEVLFNTELESLDGDTVLRTATLKNNKDGKITKYSPSDPKETFGVFVFTGHEPITEPFVRQVERNDAGYIPTNEDMQTSVPGIYAAGDLRPKKLRQLATAVSDGAIAATDAERYITQTKERLGITIEAAEIPSDDVSSSESFLDSDIVNDLKPILDSFENQLTIQVVGSDDNQELSKEMESFANEIAEVSDNIAVSFSHKNNDAVKSLNADFYPVITLLDKENNPTGIYFNGVPGGHEFNSFVLAMYNVAGKGQEVPQDTIERIQALSPATIQVGVTLNCSMCPDVVQATQLIARYNPQITAHMIDITHFSEFQEKHNVMSVPAMVIDDAEVIFGRKPMEEIISLLE